VVWIEPKYLKDFEIERVKLRQRAEFTEAERDTERAEKEKWRGIAEGLACLFEEAIRTIENISGDTPRTERFRELLNEYEAVKEGENNG
jgi:hypothetical protein